MSRFCLIFVTFTCFAQAPPTGLTADGRQLRIDILWEGERHDHAVYEIQRGPSADGPWELLPEHAIFPIYSDFIGQPERRFFYRVRRAHHRRGRLTPQSDWSAPVSGTSQHRDRVGLINEVQEASVRFVTIGSHPRSGLTHEWIKTRGHQGWGHWKVGVASATGMGLANFVVASERGYIARAESANKVLKALRFLDQQAERFHGAFSHWINNDTGEAMRFSEFDDGADIVETALLVQGLIIVREYFSADSATEREIRETANRIWRGVDWTWFRPEGADTLLWHWSPKFEWKMNMPVHGFCEAEILYLLGIASPTHPIPLDCYFEGWRGPHFSSERSHFGTPLRLGKRLGGCTFWYYYSHIGIDPKRVHFKGRSLMDHFRDLCTVQVNYMRSQATRYRGYDRIWGLSAAPGPDGYAGYKPGPLDDGTIVPAASISAYLYAPQASQQSLETMYYDHGKTLWQEFGFIQSFNLTRDWSYPTYLGIDAGTVAPMLENYRSGLLWRMFMNAPEIREAMKTLENDPRWKH
jgi:hypothetical protein